MNESALKNIIEATLLAAGRPLSIAQFSELFDERERPTPEELRNALNAVAADYENRGVELLEVASGWRIQVRAQYMDVVSRLWQERPTKYSRALLETLALIAYRQPITRSEIEEIRGVAISSTIMRTLQERNWIRVLGHREVPGRPELLGTTREFLDYFGLRSLDALPTLAELKDVENIGVQLEFPTGAAPVEDVQSEPAESEISAKAEPAGSGEADSLEAADVSDCEEEDAPASDQTPTMVAGAEDEDSVRVLRAPPEDDPS